MVTSRQLLTFAAVVVFAGGAVFGAAAQADSPAPFTYLYDTGAISKQPLTADDMTSKTGWTKIAEDQTAHAFQGDTVVMNDKLAVVLRQEGQGTELYSRGSTGLQLRASLVPISPAQVSGPVHVTTLKNAEDGIVIDAPTLGVRCELLMGQPYVKMQPLEGTAKLRVEAPCRFCVLPDFFADDMVIDATDVPVPRADIPSENFLLHFLDNGDALLMCVWDNRDQDVRVNVAGAESARRVTSSEIAFGKEGTIWVALLEADGIWHMRDIAEEDRDKELRLDWQWPYPALWRVDWHRLDSLTDSWEMLTQNADDAFTKYGMLGSDNDYGATTDWWGVGSGQHPRSRWNTGLGWYLFPCWVDKNGTGYLQPLEKKRDFVGPALVYPINRIADTPLDRFTIVDVVRATLGVGPCEYILDLEGQKEQRNGIATCAARDILDEIYTNGTQKEQRAAVEKALDDVSDFVRLIRGRIHQYQAFGREIRDYLAEEKKKNAELAGFITEMETLAKQIDLAIEARQEGIKPAGYGPAMLERFRTELVDYDGPDAEQRCKKYTKELVTIGDNQDELVSECRYAVKIMRQRAALAMATEPQAAEIINEIRARTQEALRNPAHYEAARH